MDDLFNLIAGTQPVAASSPKSNNKSQDYSNLVTDKVLDGLKRTESGGNPLAVNKDTKALGAYQFMPDTAATLHKQGIKFNVFDEGESRDAAKQLLTSFLNKNGGDLNKALAQYGGFVTKDPSKYVSSVLANSSTQQTQQTQQSQQPSSDPLFDLIAGSSKPKANLSETGAVTTEGNLTPQQMESYVGPANKTPAEPKDFLSVAKGGVQKFLNQNPIKEGLSTLAEKTQIGPRAAGEFDTAFGIVPATYGAVVQGIARTANTPQAAEAIGKAAAGSIEKPMGRLFGVTENPAYQKPLGGITEPIAKEINRMSNVLGLTPEQISEKLNIPVEDVKQMAVTSSFALPNVVSPVLGEVGSAVKSAATTVAKPLQQMAKELKIVRPGQLSKAEAQAQFEAKQGTVAGAAQAESLGTAKPTTPETPYTELSYSEKGLPLDEQSARSQTINRVLGADHTVDLSAIEGKGKERATNYAVSNTDTPMGNYLKENFNNEQKGLAKYGESLVKKSGGTLGLDESTLYKRGNVVLKPLNDLKDYFDKATSKIYAERDAVAKNIPVEANKILEILNDKSINQANTETIGLERQARARMEQLKMIDKDGNPLPTNAKISENFRQFLNEQYDHKNSNFHSKLKEAVDEDVLANLGTDSPIYKEARNLVTLRKNTLDNPNGIAQILDSQGPKGINRKVPIEKIAQRIADMPVDQITHVIDTLKNVPSELQPQAIKAQGEIKAQFLNQAIVQKSPSSLTKYMESNKEVMNRLFTPEEMAEIRDYHNASHILKTDTGYKGSAVQKINVEQKLLPKIAGQVYRKGMSVGAEVLTGGSTLGTAAMITNELLSQSALKKQAKLQAQAEQKAFVNTQKRFVPIKDLINKEQK